MRKYSKAVLIFTTLTYWAAGFQADAAHYLLYVLTAFLFALVGRCRLTLSHPR